MATKREAKKIVTGVTKEQFEEALSAYAIDDARIEKINAEMDAQITKIREKYAKDLHELTERKDSNYDIVQTYCMEHQELFTAKKSFETIHGKVGFRTGTPKLKTLKGFTWSSVTQLLKEFLPDYVRITEEPAKDKLLADREIISDYFKKVGVAVEQDETFFIELKKEEIAQ